MTKGFLLLFAMDCHTRSVECNFIVVKIVRTSLITFCHSKKNSIFEYIEKSKITKLGN